MQQNIYCYHCFAQITDTDNEICPECGNRYNVHYAQSNELPAGTYLSSNRYIVGKSIGNGGFGITYIGFDTKLKKKVLIKETFYSGIFKRNRIDKDNPEPLKVTYGNDISLEDIMKKTEKECVSLSEAEGLENIVKVYDWFSENNTAYIITEFINGVTLYDRVTTQGRYTWDDLKDKITPLMNSLEALHEKQILHRDIKPQNIMIRQSKHTSESFVLIDFGLARSSSTRTLATVGLAFSPGYSPLEQRTFVKKDGTYTDIYALAATIYFALTGEEPNEDICDTVEENFPKINSMNSEYGVPISVVRALKSALSVNITKRCKTIAEFNNIINSTKDRASAAPATAAPIPLNKNTSVNSSTVMANKKTTKTSKPSSKTIAVKDTTDEIDNTIENIFSKVENPNNDNAEAETYVVIDKPSKLKYFWENSKIFISVVTLLILGASVFTFYSFNPPTNSEPRAYSHIESQSTDIKTGSAKSDSNSSTASSEKSDSSSLTTSSKKSDSSSSTTGSKKSDSSSSTTGSKKSDSSSKAASSTAAAAAVNNKVTVPNIVGKSVNDAMNTLTSNNLYYTGNYTYSDTVPKGEVISQSPSEGTEVNKNSHVTFVISDGKQPEPQEQQVVTYEYTVSNNGGDSTSKPSLPSLNDMSFEDFVVGKWYAHYVTQFDKITEYYSKDEFQIDIHADGTFEMWNKDGEYCKGEYTIYKEESPTGITLYALYLSDCFESDKHYSFGAYNPWGDIHAEDNYRLCSWHNDGGFTRSILDRES